MNGAVSRRRLLGRGVAVAVGAVLLPAAAGCSSTAPIPGPHPGACRPVTKLPGKTMRFAWTVDDGVDLATLRAYLDLVESEGVPLTFCATHALGANWEAVKRPLRRLVDAGTAQVANHTWSHRALTTLSDDDVRAEIERNEEWIQQTFKVTSRPYLRPPEGKWDSRVARLAGELGFTTMLMWDASFNDSGPISSEKLLANADRSFFPGAVLLGHANVPTASEQFAPLVAMMRQRGLQPVTLDQALGTSRAHG